MRVISQTKRLPSQILFAFDEVVDSAVRRVRWAVAYSTARGCIRLIKRISERMTDQQWSQTKKCFVTSLDFGITDPRALEILASLPNSRVLIANPETVARSGFTPIHAYHSKLYLFDSLATTGYVVGSANLTESALLYNTETVVTGKASADDPMLNDVWDFLVRDTAELTPALLAEYRLRRSRARTRVFDAEPGLVPPVIVAAGLQTMAAAIAAGTNPVSFDHFWVEAGSMSSGGSHNQLELPRRANQFFGFVHERYENPHLAIGSLRLTHGERTWSDRPLTWHGHNRMERLNLPTEADGGLAYKNTAVLFRRQSCAFELEALPWEDPGAIAWRDASIARGTLFRLGVKGGRSCGLF